MSKGNKIWIGITVVLVLLLAVSGSAALAAGPQVIAATRRKG